MHKCLKYLVVPGNTWIRFIRHTGDQATHVNGAALVEVEKWSHLVLSLTAG